MASQSQLPAVLVHHPEVHEQVGLQHVQFEVIAQHGDLAALPHGFEQHVQQRAVTKRMGANEIGHKIRQRHQT